jgi:hypothetical protein
MDRRPAADAWHVIVLMMIGIPVFGQQGLEYREHPFERERFRS